MGKNKKSGIRLTRAATRAAKAIEDSSRALILSHVRPDGDAVGCIIAATAMLRAMGKTAIPRSAHEMPHCYKALKGASWIKTVGPDSRLPLADTVIFLDASNAGRSQLTEHIRGEPVIVNIDHHVSNDRFGHVSWIDGAASSTGEMLLRLAIARKWPLPPAARDALYTALVTDTGRFSYSNTSPETLRLAADLIERGAKPDRLYRSIYCSRRTREFAIEAAARSSLSTACDGGVAWISLTRRDFMKAGATPVDAQEFAQIPMSLDGVEVGVFFYELPSGDTKASLRSAGRVDVNRIAGAFGGGGHKLAAGCELPGTVGPASKKVLALCRGVLRKR